MERVRLVVVLRLLACELQIQRDLIALVHHGALTPRHAADVEALQTRDRLQILFGACDELVGGGGFLGVSPEDDDVRKHDGGEVGL